MVMDDNQTLAVIPLWYIQMFNYKNFNFNKKKDDDVSD